MKTNEKRVNIRLCSFITQHNTCASIPEFLSLTNIGCLMSLSSGTLFVGLVVKVSASRAADLQFDARLRHGDFSRLSHTSDLHIGTSVATLPGAWRYRVSTGMVGPVSVYCDRVR